VRQGHNYLGYLEGFRETLLAEVQDRETSMLSKEADFRRLLPPNESPLEVSKESLKRDEVLAAREAFRAAHVRYCRTLTRLNEVEDALYDWPEDQH